MIMKLKYLTSSCLYLFMITTSTQAASLRTITELHTDVVYLSDLFDGVYHDRGIGPSPNVGERLFIEAPQLDAIARQFNVDWHSGSPGDRILLSRPGYPLTREQALEILRPALELAGMPIDANIDLEGYTPPMVSSGDAITGTVKGLDYEPASGRFTATLAIEAAKLPIAQTRVSGRVQEMISLPVATHRLLPGDIIVESDIKIGRLNASLTRNEVARSAAQVVGMEVRKPISSGSPLGTGDFSRPFAVQKGQVVFIQLEYPGLLISAQGVAAESGALGDRVKVANVTSRAILNTQVTGNAQVRIATSAVTLKAAISHLSPSEAKP